MNSIQGIEDQNPDALYADGFGEAIVGYGAQYPMLPVVIYDYDKCLEILMKDNQWDYEIALEWMEFNVVSAYVGQGTPIFIKLAELTEKIVDFDGAGTYLTFPTSQEAGRLRDGEK